MINLLRRLAGHGAAALVLACAAAAAGAQVPATATATATRPAIEPARGGECVADPAFMRRNHPELLKHQRNQTVHQGVRDPRASLKGCIECHASKASGSVAVAKTDFCISCHSFVAVKVDCFECHASKPPPSAFLPLNHPHADSAATRLAAQWRQLPLQPGAKP
ncbi:MAG: hypothetical protein Q8N44_06075 [Rubrivivax sp.]|nr:hypothetical protein [Rubrivivax sp.]